MGKEILTLRDIETEKQKLQKMLQGSCIFKRCRY